MKRTFLICLVACCSASVPRVAFAQQFINPDTIHQAGDIILQNTDVYYGAMAPPADTDTRAGLSNQADVLLDSNGGSLWGYGEYLARTHGARIQDVLGKTAVWQRLFTARRKADGTPSDIIAGSSVTDSIAHGPVIISKNEDVDFRASGRIILKSGFHVKPGAFFHAYTERKWGVPVLSDEFDSSAINRSQWLVSDSASNSDYGLGPVCAYDSNITLVSDPQAHDGHALDIALIERDDSCKCYVQSPPFDSCGESANIHNIDTLRYSTGLLRSCPFPYFSRGNPMGAPKYDHAPYGKYEIRLKIPHIPHHMNTWGWDDDDFEFDHEGYGSDDLDSGWYNTTIFRPLLYGPFTGKFDTVSGIRFISHGLGWWPGANDPKLLVIDGFPYGVKLLHDTVCDTVVADGDMTYKRWPASLLNRDSVTFYYARRDLKFSDSLQWTVTQDSAHHWRILDAPYHDSSGQLLHFSKTFQPFWITLKTHNGLSPIHKTLNCRWDSSINYPTDRGLLYIDTTDTSSTHRMLATDLHSNTEADTFFVEEGDHYHYPMGKVQWANPSDSANPSSYTYHTFTLELLPNEAVFLLDSNVVRRYPDRLIPSSDKHTNWISTLPRFTPNFHIGGVTLDGLSANNFETLLRHITDCPGCWTVGGRPAAHTRIDYAKIWDVPDDVNVSGFPH